MHTSLLISFPSTAELSTHTRICIQSFTQYYPPSCLYLFIFLRWCRVVCPPQGLQRDVVNLGWPIAPSYMSPNAGSGGGGLRGLSQWVQLYIGALINFGDLTPYLTYDSQFPILLNNFPADDYVTVTQRDPACAAGTYSCTPLWRSFKGGSETWATIMIILALQSSTPCQLAQAGLLSPNSYVKHYAVNDVAISSAELIKLLRSAVFLLQSPDVTSCYKQLSWRVGN